MRIVLCDDHRVFSEALAYLFANAGHHIVACTTDPGLAVGVLSREPVDVCVMDLCFTEAPDVGGVTAVLDSLPHLAVVVLTASPDRRLLDQATAAGARAVALKGDDFPEILRVVEAATRPGAGDGPRWSASARALRTPPSTGDQHHLGRFLTVREREVLTRLVQGEDTAGLARSMGVRPSTVRTHVDAVLTKLGAHSRLEAVAYAVREGLVDPLPDLPDAAWPSLAS